MKVSKVQRLTISALLIAVGILIPLFSPIKLVLEPASFTLGSHVAIFIGMFISPVVAISVAIGTTFGFFIGGFPIIVVLRAATHVIFAGIGALILEKRPKILSSTKNTILFSLLIGILHAACEVVVVMFFYFGGGMQGAYYSQGFLQSIIGLVGIGSVVHSMIDFQLSFIIWRGLVARKGTSFNSIN